MRRQLMTVLVFLCAAGAAVAAQRQSRHPRLNRITLLRPTAGSETAGRVVKLSWSDGTESFSMHSKKPDVAARADARWATEFTIDAAAGTFTAKRVPATDTGGGRFRAQSSAVTDIICDDPYNGCTSDDPYGGTTTGYFKSVLAQDDHSATILTLGVTPCRGDLSGYERVDNSDRECLSWSSGGYRWDVAGCSSTALQLLGQISNGVYSEVSALYQAFSTVYGAGGITNCVIVMHSDGYGHIGPAYVSLPVPYRVTEGPFSAPSCGRVSSGGGGSGGGPSDPGGSGGGDGGGGGGGGDETCVDVFEAISEEYLGTCCGTTTEEIVNCAIGYL
jgi:hypothetical protein